MQRPTMSIRAMLVTVAFIALACVALVRASSTWSSLMFSAALAAILFAVLAAILRRGVKQAFWIGFALVGSGYLWMAHWPGEFATPESSVLSWRMQNDSNGTLASTQLLVHAYNKWLPLVRKLPEPPAQTSTPMGLPPGFQQGGQGFAGGGGYGAPSGYGGGGYGGNIPSRTGYGRGRRTAGYGTTSVAATAASGGAPSLPAAATPVVSYPAMHEFMRVGHSLFTIVLAFLGGVVGAILYNTRERAQTEKAEPVANG